jgi:hypothetical protein
MAEVMLLAFWKNEELTNVVNEDLYICNTLHGKVNECCLTL